MDHRLPFLGGPLPPGFRRWSVTLAPGATLPYVEDDWRDALVTVTEGRIEVECLAGGHAAFEAGAMVWMVGLELRAIHNRDDADAVMVAVAREGGYHPSSCRSSQNSVPMRPTEYDPGPSP